MRNNRKNTAASKELLEKALQQDNVIDMRLFFDAKKEDKSEYWLSAMILCTDNITTAQKIKLARQCRRKRESVEKEILIVQYKMY